MSATTVLQSLFKYKAWAIDELFTEIENINADTHPAERHLAIRLLNHIYIVDRIFAAHLRGTTHNYTGANTTDTPPLSALRAAFAASDQWYVDYVAAATVEQLAEKRHFSFTDGQAGCMSREEMLAHVATHGGYHRGAIGRILAQLDMAPPRDTLTVFLHRTEPERRVA